MFQIDWAQKDVWEKEQNSFDSQNSKLDLRDVRRAHLLHWEDHCLECSAPLCYSTCQLYVARPDKRCARLLYGIYPNPRFKGFFDFGADIRFRRWGKIEALVYGKTSTVRFQRAMDRLNRFVTYPPDVVTAPYRAGNSNGSSNGRVKVFWKENLAKARDKCFSWFAPTRETVTCDEFVLECFSPDQQSFRLLLEYSVGNVTADHTFVGEIKLRESFNIVPGWNFRTLPGQVFGFGAGNRAGKIMLYPENNAERRLIFTWLDLVKYSEPRANGAREQQHVPKPAAKVKCVAWDLDNTLWKGILAEDGPTNLIPRSDAIELIKKLDEKGIIQSILSKNNYADAWAVIERLGLRDYFLYPAINWRQKSKNLREVAEKLNLNPDTFAVIDDSSFERAEIQAALPQVRVYSDQQIDQLLTYQEFDVPATEASRKRRASYQTELTRQKEFDSFDGNYEDFLRSCEMKLRLFVPREEQHISRCLELVQRANQLNLSGKRYIEAEFRELLSRPGILCTAMYCLDRFGDYGIVGFASVDESQKTPVLKDFVLSCRVARKKVEHAFLQWLASREAAQGKQVLFAELVRTDRNKPLLQVFDDLHFRPGSQNSGRSLMELPLQPCPADEYIVRVEALGL